MKKLLSLIAALLLIVCAFTIAARADFGDFGGDADFGDFGGGDYDGGYDYGGDYSSGSSSFIFLGGGTGSTVITIIIVVIVIALLIIKNKNGAGGGRGGNVRGVNVGNRETAQSALRPMGAYRELDPEFNEADLREKLSNLFVQMQNCWTARDIEPLRPYFTDALFTQFERQAAQKKADGLTNRIERVSVQMVEFRGFRQDGVNDHLIVKLQARMIDYTVKDDTGKVVSGSPDREKFMTYEWDLSRTTGIKTGGGLKKDELGRTVCPSCGAPLDINASARCEYCGSVINASAHDWAICNITAISQQTM